MLLRLVIEATWAQHTLDRGNESHAKINRV